MILRRKRTRIIAASGIVVLGAVLAALLLRPSTRVPVVVLSESDPCPEATLGGLPAAEFLAVRLQGRVHALALSESDAARFCDSVAAYLAASMAACEHVVAEFRAAHGFDPRTLSLAHRTTRTVVPALAPDPAILNSDRAVAEWFISYARPWAWVEPTSIEVSQRTWTEFSQEFTAYHRDILERRKRSVGFGPSPYSSVFGAIDVPESERATARLARLSLTFGLREGDYSVAPSLGLVIYLYVMQGEPGVLAILLDGNYTGLWRDLAL